VNIDKWLYSCETITWNTWGWSDVLMSWLYQNVLLAAVLRKGTWEGSSNYSLRIFRQLGHGLSRCTLQYGRKVEHKDVFDRLNDVPDVLHMFMLPPQVWKGRSALEITHSKAYLDSYSFMTSVRSSYGQLGNSMSTSPRLSGDRLESNLSMYSPTGSKFILMSGLKILLLGS